MPSIKKVKEQTKTSGNRTGKRRSLSRSLYGRKSRDCEALLLIPIHFTNQLHFSDLKAGRLDDRVVTSLLRFWEARNVKKSGELMSVDFMLLNEKCRRYSKIRGKKVTVGLISATPLNATLLFPTEALKPRLQPDTWCEAGSSQGVKRESETETETDA
ncbi:unnamed protein product [Brassica rapa]|uniref:Uncharacterized protein n=1 Tax=Brassica campestris TaxID=3711 RepID=A0A8D9HCM5_BRACM|nr:unnamed protein product [Brassica rapa]